jgi:integrase
MSSERCAVAKPGRTRPVSAAQVRAYAAKAEEFAETAASDLEAGRNIAGVHMKVVSERLGHSSPAFTMTVYQHVILGMHADAARLFCEALYGDPPAL